MPIENEVKYVLHTESNLEREIRLGLSTYNATIHEIQQAYIGSEGRIRRRVETYKNGYRLDDPVTSLIFTYKHKLTNQKGSLELEMPMTKEDFELAWNEEKNISLIKTRISIPTSWSEIWEIDFFKDNNNTYLIIAECELMNGQERPTRMPDIIKDNLLYSVPEGDLRFKNRKLSDPKKVSEILESLVELDNDKKRIKIPALSLQGVFPS